MRECKCRSRSGVKMIRKTEQVGKPTAWGHVHTTKKEYFRCNDCGGDVPDFRTQAALALYAPPRDDE